MYPHPLVVIGISPKSFGFYYFNRLEKKGTEFLQNMPDSGTMKGITRHALPGTDLNTFWLLAMETVKENYGKEFRLKASYRRYRFLQILHVFRLQISRECSSSWRISGTVGKDVVFGKGGGGAIATFWIRRLEKHAQLGKKMHRGQHHEIDRSIPGIQTRNHIKTLRQHLGGIRTNQPRRMVLTLPGIRYNSLCQPLSNILLQVPRIADSIPPCQTHQE